MKGAHAHAFALASCSQPITRTPTNTEGTAIGAEGPEIAAVKPAAGPATPSDARLNEFT